MFWSKFSFKKWFLTEAVNVPLLTGQYRKAFPQATEQEITDKINLATAADPTPNKKYVSWVFRELLNKRIRLPEDNATVQQQLALFDKSKPALKRVGKQLDIDKYDKNTLWQTLGELGGATSGRQEKLATKREGAQEIYDDGEWLVMKMTKGEACSFYARGTKWCTSDPKTAEFYLESGPIYMIYHNKQIYAQFHIESGQLMNPQDVAIDPADIPDKLKEIIRDYVIDDDKAKRNELFGIKERIIVYPDGHYWGTQDHKSFFLIGPDKEEEVVIRVRGGEHGLDVEAFVSRPNEKDAEALFNKHYMDVLKKYKSPSEWNKYILDFLVKDKSIHHIGTFNKSWTLGDLSKEELQTLQKARPDIFPEVHMETSDGYLWCVSARTNSGSPGELVLMDNWMPVLIFTIVVGYKYISYGKWIADNVYQTILKSTEFDKQKYSLATTELILRDELSHLDTRRNIHGNWSLNDLTPENRSLVLEKYPDFDQPISLINKISPNRKEVVREIAHTSDMSSLMLLDNDTVALSDFDVVNIKNLTDHHSASQRVFGNRDIAYKILTTLREKVNGTFGQSDDWYFRGLVDAGDFDKLKKTFPFVDDEIIELIKKHPRSDYGEALDAAAGSVIMPKVIKMIYDKLAPHSNDKFKVLLKNNEIYFTINYDMLAAEFKKDQKLKHLYEEYKNWKRSMTPDWDELEKEITQMPREYNKEKFKELYQAGYNHPEHRKYDIRL